MCIFGTSKQPVTPAPAPAPAVSDVPSVIKNEKTGSVFKRVDDPSIEELKIKPRKKQGTSVDTNLSAVEEKLATKSRSNSLKDKQSKINRQNAAKRNFNKRKYSRSISGRRTGTA